MKSKAIQTQLSATNTSFKVSLSQELEEGLLKIKRHPNLDEENILSFESFLNYFERILEKFKEIREESLKEFQVEKPLLDKRQKTVFTKRNLWFKEQIPRYEECLKNGKDLLVKNQEILGFF